MRKILHVYKISGSQLSVRKINVYTLTYAPAYLDKKWPPPPRHDHTVNQLKRNNKHKHRICGWHGDPALCQQQSSSNRSVYYPKEYYSGILVCKCACGIRVNNRVQLFAKFGLVPWAVGLTVVISLGCLCLFLTLNLWFWSWLLTAFISDCFLQNYKESILLIRKNIAGDGGIVICGSVALPAILSWFRSPVGRPVSLWFFDFFETVYLHFN